jgi:hypothetical protein
MLYCLEKMLFGQHKRDVNDKACINITDARKGYSKVDLEISEEAASQSPEVQMEEGVVYLPVCRVFQAARALIG